MAAANKNDINLLPKELKGSNRKSGKSQAKEKVEYTEANNPEKNKKAEKKSIFSRLFSVFKRKKNKPEPKSKKPAPEKKVHHVLPKGKDLPSALFARENKKEQVAKPKVEIAEQAPVEVSKDVKIESVAKPKSNGISAHNITSMHAPNFLSAPHKNGSKKPLELEKKVTLPQKDQPKKISWFKRIFFKKQKPKKEEVKNQVKKTEEVQAKVVADKSTKGETQAPVHRVSTFDVNLLTPEYTETFQDVNPLKTLSIWVGSTVVLVAILFGSLQLYQNSSQEKLAKNEQVVVALKETIATYNQLEGEDDQLREKVDAASILLDQHISWHEFLGKLESVTIPEVTYVNLAASTEGAISISAFANDYTGLARQITVYQNTEWILDIGISSASLVKESTNSPEGVAFDILLVISPDILALEQ
jgi:Tfp pilus assembly protein PilN